MSSAQNLNAAITVLLELTVAAGRVSSLIAVARAEGRDLTVAELDGLRSADDAVRAELASAIQDAKG